MIDTLVIATHNAGKLREMKELLANFPITLRSSAELHLPEPEETGTTFDENALIKARAAASATGLPALADDSGLAVPALSGAPGIYSARWAGADKNFDAAFARIRRELAAEGAPENSPAYFACVLALALPNGGEHLFAGRVDGTLAFPPRGKNGFGYDPVFIPAGHTRTFGELSSEIKQSVSHRARALAKLVAFFKMHDSVAAIQP